MSAWMFDAKGMHRVVDAIRWLQAETKAPLSPLFAVDNDQLGLELLKMNARAIYERYGENVAPNGYKHRASKQMPAPLQLCKTLRCYRYQCSEGDVDQMPLYEAIDLAISTYEHLGFSSTSRGYDALHWG